MGGGDVDNASKKPANSYAMLQMKMNEIERARKPKAPSSSHSKSNPSSSSSKSKSTSDKIPKKASPTGKEFPSGKKNQNMDPNVPDRSYGDFYCPTCDSHMNSDAMWEAHITGKRHLKNIKKGDPDPKYEDLDVESNIKYEIRNVKDPIVGLSYIHEIRRKEVGAPCLYTCFLCQANFPSVPLVIEHVIGMKHRLNFMRENSQDDYQLLGATDLKKGQMEPLVAEFALKLEQKFGRGSVKVKQERIRQSSYLPVPKRAFDDDDDDDDDDVPRKPKSQKYDEKNPYVWQAVDREKKSNFKDIKDCREIINERRRYAYSSDEEVDMRKREDYVKRPVYDRHSSNYKSSPASRESTIKVTTYTRMPSHSSPEERYRHSRCSPPRESLKKDTFNSKSPPYAPPDDQFYHSRSYQIQEKESGSSKDYPLPAETKVQQPESNFDVLKDFVQKVYALPTEIFLKIVLLKLEKMEIKGIDELSLLSQVISKAQVVLCNKLPPDVQAVLKHKMSQHSESSVQQSSATPTVVTQIARSSPYNAEANFKPPGPQSPGSDFNFIKDILNRARGNVESSAAAASQNMALHQASQNVVPHQASQNVVPHQASQNVVPHQSSQNMVPHQASQPNVMSYSSSLYGNINSSYQNGNQPSSTVNYSYNTAPPSSSSSIPGLTLTEENRDAQPSYNSYQPHYPDPSSSYPPYRY